MAAAEKINENLEALENSLLRLTKPGRLKNKLLILQNVKYQSDRNTNI